MSPLLKLYKHALKQADFTYPWQELVSHFLHRGEVSVAQVEGLKRTLVCIDLSTPKECFFFFRHFLTLAIISSKSKTPFSLAALFEHAQAHPFWRDSHLEQLYYEACAKLCAHPTEGKEFPAIPLIEGEDGWKGMSSHKLQEGTEYALLMGCLGLLCDKHEMQTKALEHAQWLATLLDHRDFPFYSLWCTDTTCDLLSILSMNYVLFSLCDCLTKQTKWQRLADRQLQCTQRLFDQSREDLPLLPPLLYNLLMEKDPGLSFCVDTSVKTPSLFLRGQFDRASFVCSLSGKNSGMGAFHKTQVKVVNFGPWSAPLGECSGFGIKRSLSDFCAVSSRSLSGWTRFQPSQHNPDTWAKAEIVADEGALNLSISPTPVTEAGTLSFAFLIQSEEAQIGNHRFLPATMRHYVGESSLVTFYSGKEKIEISTCERREVELIPLAGGGHFWGANFLLAFSFSPSDPVLSCSIY